MASTLCKLNFNVWDIFNSEIHLFYVIIKHRGLYSCISISLPILLCLRFPICHNSLLFLLQQLHGIWYTENTQALKCYEYVCRTWDPQENLTGIPSKEIHHIKTACWQVLSKKVTQLFKHCCFINGHFSKALIIIRGNWSDKQPIIFSLQQDFLFRLLVLCIILYRLKDIHEKGSQNSRHRKDSLWKRRDTQAPWLFPML